MQAALCDRYRTRYLLQKGVNCSSSRKGVFKGNHWSHKQEARQSGSVGKSQLSLLKPCFMHPTSIPARALCAFHALTECNSVAEILDHLAITGYPHSFCEEKGVWRCVDKSINGVHYVFHHVHCDAYDDRSLYVNIVESLCGRFKGYHLYQQ